MTLDAGNRFVSGELYDIRTNWSEVIDRLDAYEGCTEDDPEPHEYRREIVTAYLPSGSPIKAWSYVNIDPCGMQLIESGDYLSLLKGKSRSAVVS